MASSNDLSDALGTEVRKKLDALAEDLQEAKGVAIAPAQLLLNLLPAVLGEEPVERALGKHIDALRNKLGTLPSDQVKKLSSSGMPAVNIEFPAAFEGIERGHRSVLNARTYRCPFDDAEFSAPVLKGKSMVIELDERYQLNRYVRPTDANRSAVDFSLFEITVCPSCLFAAQDSGFNYLDSAALPPQWRDQKYLRVTDAHRKAMQEEFPARAELAQAAGDGGRRLFTVERTPEDAAVAIEMAAHCLGTLRKLAQGDEKHILTYKKGVLLLMKAKQYEAMLGALEDPDEQEACKRKRLDALALALEEFKNVEGTKLDALGFRTITTYYVQKFWAADELGDVEARTSASGAICQSYDRYCIRDKDKTPVEVKRTAKWGRDLIEFRIYELSKEKEAASGDG